MKNEDYTLFPIPTRLLDLMGLTQVPHCALRLTRTAS